MTPATCPCLRDDEGIGGWTDVTGKGCIRANTWAETLRWPNQPELQCFHQLPKGLLPPEVCSVCDADATGREISAACEESKLLLDMAVNARIWVKWESVPAVAVERPSKGIVRYPFDQPAYQQSVHDVCIRSRKVSGTSSMSRWWRGAGLWGTELPSI